MQPLPPNPHKQRRGLSRLAHAAGFTLQGLSAALRHESAFRQEAAAALVMLPAAFWVGQGPWQVLALSATVLLVMVVELLNSAIEAVVDRVSLELHPLAKRAKDYGSAAVALSLLLCGATWALALFERWR